MDFRERQQRPRSYNDPGHAHELTFSCYRKQPFLTDRTSAWFAEATRNACRNLNYSLWAYVLMPDHVHLIVCPRDRQYDGAKFLKALKEPVSRRAILYLKREAPDWLERLRAIHGTRVVHHFWQPGRGHDRNITTSKTLLGMIDYIHQNPVRRNLVQQAHDWKWSSAGWFEGSPLNDLQPDPIHWDWLEDAPQRL